MKNISYVLIFFVTFGLVVPAFSSALPGPVDNPNVIALGHARDPESGKMVEGYAIVHYKNPNARGGHGGGGGGTTASCYGFLSRGAKWKTLEPWVLNPNNPDGLSPDFLLSNVAGDIAKWESAANANILGDGSLTGVVVDTSTVDGVNGVMFAPLSEANAIAVTYVWGIFSGPPGGRELVEWDQIYNTNYAWSASGEASKMDFENIATHELGHSLGLADLYTSGCADQTMYGYAGYGETNKRTLEAGDIAGINALY